VPYRSTRGVKGTAGCERTYKITFPRKERRDIYFTHKNTHTRTHTERWLWNNAKYTHIAISVKLEKLIPHPQLQIAQYPIFCKKSHNWPIKSLIREVFPIKANKGFHSQEPDVKEARQVWNPLYDHVYVW